MVPAQERVNLWAPGHPQRMWEWSLKSDAGALHWRSGRFPRVKTETWWPASSHEQNSTQEKTTNSGYKPTSALSLKRHMITVSRFKWYCALHCRSQSSVSWAGKGRRWRGCVQNSRYCCSDAVTADRDQHTALCPHQTTSLETTNTYTGLSFFADTL